VLRLKSDYLAIATLGFAEIIRAIFQWDALGPITNGANVMREYKDLTDVTIPFTDIPFPPTLYVFLATGICIALIMLLINSSYGRAFKAIRDDEVAAEAMGINLFKHKEMSFVISSFFAGVSGALLAMYQYTVQAAQFKSAMTYEILLIVVIGGIGSISGSCIASFLYIAASEWWLRGLDMGQIPWHRFRNDLPLRIPEIRLFDHHHGDRALLLQRPDGRQRDLLPRTRRIVPAETGSGRRGERRRYRCLKTCFVSRM
jgi:branched-chain amino acid transport system permease protein